MTTEPPAPTNRSTIDGALDAWQSRLLDLSHRNPLIQHRRTKARSLELKVPDLYRAVDELDADGGGWKVYERSEKEPPPVEPEEETTAKQTGDDELPIPDGEAATRPEEESEPDPFPELQEPVDGTIYLANRDGGPPKRHLINLSRTHRTHLSERGVHTLFLAVGYIHTVEGNQDEIARSPLLLFPVNLKRRSSREPWFLHPVAAEEIVVNPTLRHKLKREFGFDLPEIADDADRAEGGALCREYFERVRALIANHDRLSLVEDAWLDCFSFMKLVIYDDIARHRERMTSHPGVRQIAGEADAETANAQVFGEATELDRRWAPRDCFHILNADSSQLLALEAARARHSFVLQGPPGTGKSQTIANLVGQSLKDGKRVLFVSEKMAALQVVKRRLDNEGLGDLCLELHSHQAAPKTVVQKLVRLLDEAITPEGRPTISDAELDRLTKDRERLNEYVTALHSVREPLGRSISAMLGRAAEVAAASATQFDDETTAKIAALDAARWQELQDQVADLARLYDVVRAGESFPWHGARPVVFSGSLRQSIESEIAQARDRLRELGERSAALAAAFGAEPPATLQDAEGHLAAGDLFVEMPALSAELVDNPSRARTMAKEGRMITDEFRDRERSALELLGKRPPGRAPVAGLVRGASQRLASAAQEAFAATPTPGDLDTARRTAQSLRDALRTLETSARELEHGLGLSTRELDAEGIAAHETIAAAILGELRLPATLLDARMLSEGRRHLVARQELWKKARAADEKFAEEWHEDAMSLDLDRLAADFRDRYSGAMRLFRPQFWADRKQLRRQLKIDWGSVDPVRVLETARTARDLREEVKAGGEEDRRFFGQYADGSASDEARLAKLLELAENVLKAVADRPVPTPIAEALAGGELAAPKAGGFARRYNEALGVMRSTHANIAGEAERGRAPLRGDAGRWAGNLERFAEVAGEERDKLGMLVTDAPWSGYSWERLDRGTEAWRLLEEAETDWSRFEERSASVFGASLKSTDTPWDEIDATVDRVEKFVAATSDPLPTTARSRLLTASDRSLPELEPAKTARAEAGRALSLVGARFESGEVATPDGPAAEVPVARLDEHLGWLSENISRLEEVSVLRSRTDALRNLGWWEAVAKVIDPALTGEQFLEKWERALHDSWIDATLGGDSCLRNFRGEDHEHLIREFRELDVKLVKASSRRILDEVGDRRANSTVGEALTIATEGKKKRRLKSVRRLMQECPTVIQRLQPCFLMSPLSVSQFLKDSETISFDMVVFDEASQVFPEDAICAISRANQVIVCGDEKQLPPTDFFSTASRDSDEDEEALEGLDQVDSILEVCGLKFADRRLRWHYRSRHEHLIAFSNHHFYDDGLVTFPAAHERTGGLGVFWEFVEDGIYGRGRSQKNPGEAARIADMVEAHIRTRPTHSLGVIALSQKQQECIEDELERRAAENHALEQFLRDETTTEPFFVKNLENVQGDERDHIVLSIGYGPDKTGRMTSSFGPINTEGGERRLNVAVTRAKKSITLVSSFTYRDVNLSATAKAGPRLLLKYLEFAERGIEALGMEASTGAAGATGGSYESPLERSIASVIRGWGFDVVPQVGCSGFRIDLGVRHPSLPGIFALGVECDGAQYHRAATARDRDRNRQSVLEGLGWSIHRIWGPDWYRHRTREEERLKAAIEAACVKAEQNAPQPEPEIEPEPVAPTNAEEAADERSEAVVVEGSDAVETIDAEPATLDSEMQEPTADEVDSAAKDDPEPPSDPESSDKEKVAKDNVDDDKEQAPSDPPWRAWAKPFAPLPMTLPPKFRDASMDDIGPQKLARLLAQSAIAENGIEEKRARKAVCAVFGIERQTTRFRNMLVAALEQLPPTVVRTDGFLYPSIYKPMVRVPGEDDATDRKMDEIPPPEVAMAAVEILREDGLLSRDDLEREVVYLFRGRTRRMTAKVREIAAAAIEAEMAAGRIKELSDGRLAPA